MHIKSMQKIDKIIVCLLFVLLGLSPQHHTYAGIHAYTNTSVLKEGKFVKIRIKESGVYKLTYEDLKEMEIGRAHV